MTPDPYRGNNGGSGDPKNPQSWNHYAYTTGDPVNYRDPKGLFIEAVSEEGDDGDDDWGAWGFSYDGCMPTYDGLWGGYYGCGSSPYQTRQFIPPPSYTLSTAQENAAESFAVDLAIAALDASQQCAGLFDIDGTGVPPNPVTLLSALYAGSGAWGSIQYGQLPSNVAAGTLPNSGAFGAIVTLNNSSGGLWYISDPGQQAAILLHELGHVYEDLFGASTTQITNDSIAATGSEEASIQASEKNQSLVETKCNLH